MEIERKWILRAIPDKIEIYGEFTTETVWFYSGDYEIKIRSMFPSNTVYHGELKYDLHGENYTIVIKGPGTLSREEVSLILSSSEFNSLMGIVNKKPIHKIVIICKLDDKELMICDVDGEFIYAEIEFDSEEEAMSYKFPYEDYVILDATYLEEYKMKNVWNRKNFNQ